MTFINDSRNKLDKKQRYALVLKLIHNVYVKEVLASQAHPRCANTHNFFGLTWEVNISEAATV